MTKSFGFLVLSLAMAGCVSSAAYAKSETYQFRNKDNQIEIDKGFRYVALNGQKKPLENCSDAFIVCANGYLSFATPRNDCSQTVDEMPKLSEMNFAARDHHAGKSWRYNSRNKNAIYEYDNDNNIVAIYYDFSGNGKVIPEFVDAETGRIDELSSYRLEAVKPISAEPCKVAS